MEKTYSLINYFDVYQDIEGDWCVNNQCVEKEGITISVDATAKDVCTYLMKEGFLNTNDMRKLAVDFDFAADYIEVYQKKGMIPLFAFTANV